MDNVFAVGMYVVCRKTELCVIFVSLKLYIPRRLLARPTNHNRWRRPRYHASRYVRGGRRPVPCFSGPKPTIRLVPVRPGVSAAPIC